MDKCENECQGKDEQCWPRCIVPTHNKKLMEVLRCSHDQGCIGHHQINKQIKDDPRKCLEEHCKAELEACD